MQRPYEILGQWRTFVITAILVRNSPGGDLPGRAYRRWLDFEILSPSGGRFDELIRGPMRKNFSLTAAEKALSFLRGAAPKA